MKTLLTILTLTFSLSTYASPQGLITGSCTVNGQAHSFTVNPGEKIGLGLLIDEDGAEESIYNVWSIEVGNYAGTSLQPIWGGFFVGIARPIGTRILVNPPQLCPVSPEHLRIQCERENEERLPKLEVNTTEFAVINGHSAPSARDIWRMTPPNGFEAVLDRLVNGELPVTCTVKFTEL